MKEGPLEMLRTEIDAIDAKILTLLAERLRVVDNIVAVKTSEGLPASLPARVEDVVAHVRHQAGVLGYPPDLAEKLWRLLIAETIVYEEERLR